MAENNGDKAETEHHDGDEPKHRPNLGHSASTGSLFHQDQTFANLDKADDTPPDTSFVAVVKQNAHILSFIALLLILTFICSYFEVLRLPVCALQTFGIAAVSFKWEEGSWLATGPYRRSRLCCQVFLLFVPLTVGALLIFILATKKSDEELVD
mmetsp:Transcript_31683/g.74679  ORF Transcript_31683/g.74679 Transcript_31683/m.74679 type:complete len:154 (+) Transcript_31683:281-742(+)